MKRLSLLLLALCVMGGAANAQKKPFRDGDVFSKGDVVLNLGIGLGNMVYNDSYTKKVPPISLSGEYAVTGNLFNNGRGVVGLGAYIGYTEPNTAHSITLMRGGISTTSFLACAVRCTTSSSTGWIPTLACSSATTSP